MWRMKGSRLDRSQRADLVGMGWPPGPTVPPSRLCRQKTENMSGARAGKYLLS